MSSRVPQVADPRLRLLTHLSGKTVYHTLLQLDVDPVAADVRDAVASCHARSWHRRDIIATPFFDASPYTAYVHATVHLLADMTVASSQLPLDVRALCAKCLDLFWPVIASIAILSEPVVSREAFAAVFTRDWWANHRNSLSLERVPCSEALDPRPAGAMCDSLPDIICLCEAPFLPPLVGLFRKAWPSKRNLEDFINKLRGIRDTVTDRVVNTKDEPTVLPNTNVCRVKDGLLIMRYFLQWFCVAHVGGYGHCKTIVTDWRTRALMSGVWNRIETMDEAQIMAETDRLFANRILTVFVISEYMEFVIRNSVAFAWLNRICGWRVYSDRLLEYCDAYRACLPLPPPPALGARVFDPRNPADADWAQAETEILLADQPTPILESVFRQRHVTTFVEESGARHHAQKPRDVAVNVMRPPRPNVIQRSNPFGDRASQTMSRKNCYVAMNEFIRRSFVIGSASRIPQPVWQFLWDKADFSTFIPPQGKGTDAAPVPTSLNAITSAQYAHFLFEPTHRVDTRRTRSTTVIALAQVRAVTHAFLDAESEFEHLPVSARFGERSATRFIAPHLRRKYTTASRIIAFVMLFYECERTAVALMLMMLRIYYQHFKSGKPMVQEALTRISVKFPYEYKVVFGILSGWREWRFIACVSLPMNMTGWQATHAKQVIRMVMDTPTARPPASADWLSFCPNCNTVYSLVTPLFTERQKSAPRFLSGKVGVFEKLRVDLDTGILYCSRRTGRRAHFCTVTPLLNCSLLGKLMSIDGRRSFVRCCQPNCTNKIERTEFDGFNEFGYACATCMQKARLDVAAALAENDKAALKDSKARARREQAELRRVQREEESKKAGYVVTTAYNAAAHLRQNLQRQYVRAHTPATAAPPDPLRRLAEQNGLFAATARLLRS